jgi:hypothetical protein
MKNIHVLPTDKPSRLRYNLSNVLVLTKESYRDYGKQVNQNIYITSDEEIKEGDWVIALDTDIVFKCNNYEAEKPIKQFKDIYRKIILTDNKDLIKDGVQAIDDEFLEWFVKNPSCEEVKVDKNWNYPLDKSWEYKLRIIPQEEHPNQIKCYCGHTTTCDCSPLEEPKQETLDKKYTEEDMIKFAFDTYCYISGIMKVPFNKVSENRTHAEDNFKEYIKSLNKQDKWETYT